MIEEDTVACEQAVTVAIVDRHPMRIDLCGGIRTSRMERRLLILWRRRTAEHLAAGCMVKARLHSRLANGLKEPHGSKSRNLAGVFRNVKADAHVALRTEVVNFVRLCRADYFV